MSHIPQFNVPMFDKVTAALRRNDFDIISPAELDSPEIRALALASPDGKPGVIMNVESYGTILGRDVTVIIDDCTGIALLPNWNKSVGARIEAGVAVATGKDIYLTVYDEELDDCHLIDWPAIHVTASIKDFVDNLYAEEQRA
jgi:hypothetical protein